MHLDEIFRIKGKNLWNLGDFINGAAGQRTIENLDPTKTYTIIVKASPDFTTTSTAWSVSPRNADGTSRGNTFYMNDYVAGQSVSASFNGASMLRISTTAFEGSLYICLVEGTATEYIPYMGEFKTIGNIWERAVPTAVSKSALAQMKPTRVAKNYISVSNTGSVGWATLRNQDYLGVFNSLSPGTYTISYKAVLNIRDDITDDSQKGWFVSGTVPGLAIDTRSNWGNVGVGVPVLDSKTFTITQEAVGKFDNVYLYGCGRGGVGKTGEATFYDIVLTEGSTAQPYYPYFAPTTVLPSLKVHGKTVQNGTPSPDNPVELSGVGDKTANLFDKNNRTRVTGYFASTGTTWAYASAGYSNKIPCKPNTTYTARYNGNSTQAVLGFGSCSTDEEPSADTPSVTVTQGVRQNNPTINTPITITTGANDKWLIVAYNISDPQHTDMADNLQIEEGSTATPYTPYGYSVDVLMGQQGVVDLGTLTYSLGTDEDFPYFKATVQDKKVAQGVAGVKIFVDGFNVATSTGSSALGPQDNTFGASGASAQLFIRCERYSTAADFKAAMSGKYLYYQRDTDSEFLPPVKHSVVLDKQLNGVGDYEDGLDFQDGTLTGNVSVKVLDGTETGWNVSSGTGWVRFYRTFDDAEAGAIVMSSHFEYHSSNNKPGIIRFGSSSKMCYLYPSLDIDTVEKWNAWLASEYAAGHPVVVAFPLDTPTTTTVPVTPIALTEKAQYSVENVNTIKGDVSAEYLGVGV